MGAVALLVGMSGGSAQAKDLTSRVLTVGVEADGVARVSSTDPDWLMPSTAGMAADPAPACHFENLPSQADAEALVRRLALEEGVDAKLVAAVARTESGLRMDQVSPKGAVGLMQLMPATAKRFGVDPCDPEGNVRGGIRYLRVLNDRYRNPLFVLAAYNAGEAAVEQHGGVPPFPETVRYVAAVINDIYEWPKAKPVQPNAGTLAQRPPPSGNVEHNAPTSWSQGFVMHVEKR